MNYDADKFVSLSQHGEDRLIHALLDPAAARYAVDVGANDGESWSNTRAFGKLGFHLLLVEPMPIYADRCAQLYHGEDRVIVENVAISSSEGEASFFVSANSAQDELAMRSSLDRSSVPWEEAERISVRTTPLESLLAKHQWPARYAFLSVDAEGHDLQVLQTAALDRYRPSIVCVEEGTDHPEIREYLTDQGFALAAMLGPNGIYKDSRQS